MQSVGNCSLGLVHTGTNDRSNTGFYGTCDASHNTTWNAKGITGWAYHLNGGAISWHCKAQPLTALSSTEAELIAVDSAVRELRHLHKLLAEFKLQVTMPTIIGQDNQSTIKLCESTHFNARTKHISLRYHHCGDQQRAGILKLEYLPTADIASDALTKQLQAEAHCRHRAVLLGEQRTAWPEPNEQAATATIIDYTADSDTANQIYQYEL